MFVAVFVTNPSIGTKRVAMIDATKCRLHSWVLSKIPESRPEDIHKRPELVAFDGDDKGRAIVTTVDDGRIATTRGCERIANTVCLLSIELSLKECGSLGI